MEKNMFSVFPEMPSKTFVMVFKKNFLVTLSTVGLTYMFFLKGGFIIGEKSFSAGAFSNLEAEFSKFGVQAFQVIMKYFSMSAFISMHICVLCGLN